MEKVRLIYLMFFITVICLPNEALQSIPPYSVLSVRGRKRSLAILSGDDGYAPLSKGRRREPP